MVKEVEEKANQLTDWPFFYLYFGEKKTPENRSQREASRVYVRSFRGCTPLMLKFS